MKAAELKEFVSKMPDDLDIVLNIEACRNDPPLEFEDEVMGAPRELSWRLKTAHQFDGESRRVAIIDVILNDF